MNTLSCLQSFYSYDEYTNSDIFGLLELAEKYTGIDPNEYYFKDSPTTLPENLKKEYPLLNELRPAYMAKRCVPFSMETKYFIGMEANVYLWYHNSRTWQQVPQGFTHGAREVVQEEWTFFKHLKLTSINEIKKAIDFCGHKQPVYGPFCIEVVLGDYQFFSSAFNIGSKHGNCQ